ncbi:hypothetical protein [Azotobacter beijerinckii]|uniref:Uncharacterized protein n=1 Tax=Azotobacter beijerinckii TaxID=170623 RepID=A0A1I4G363_9GAMM|nr:hypothetical protein [Azotobacter beijerinckii]SFL23677.1 hypothetical protein SAMN04244574_03634 [Azotobacter beijerinckii]
MATVNPWKKFIGLLPGGVRTVGTVTAVNTARGTSTVELRNGIGITARGIDVAVGSKAFIVDGQITGPAPDLPQYDIEV